MRHRGRIVIRPLSSRDGLLVYRFLQQIPAEENGVYNSAYGLGYGAYKEWLVRQVEIANGVSLTENMVEQTIYWMFLGPFPIGMGKIRHRLTAELRETGGSLSYTIVKPCRGKGYGAMLLQGLLQEARRMGLEEILFMAYSYNQKSIRAALHNKGQIYQVKDGKTYIRFEVEGEDPQ